jgi:hypothetical protein
LNVNVTAAIGSLPLAIGAVTVPIRYVRRIEWGLGANIATIAWGADCNTRYDTATYMRYGGSTSPDTARNSNQWRGCPARTARGESVAGDETAAESICRGRGLHTCIGAGNQCKLELAGAGEIRAIAGHTALIRERGVLGTGGQRLEIESCYCQQYQRENLMVQLRFHNLGGGKVGLLFQSEEEISLGRSIGHAGVDDLAEVVAPRRRGEIGVGLQCPAGD